METEQRRNNGLKDHENSKAFKVILIVLNCILLSVGQVSGPILLRLHFMHGGKKKWLNAWLLNAGFPILILPIAISSARPRTTRLVVTPWLFTVSALLGFLLGLDGYLYSFGLFYLPVSVSSLLGSTRLAFTAVFAFIIVKHKFTHYSINAVVLMTLGSTILGFHADGNRPRGESDGKYVLGCFMIIGAAALHGFIMPALEYTHLKSGTAITFNLVMQIQLLISMFATLFCTVPMIINKEFQAIPKAAAEYELGPTKYYTILLLTAIAMQFLIMGSIGLIFSSTSLFGGLVSSLLVPVQQAFAVILLDEQFTPEKGMALAMCLWGFASYLYGKYSLNYNNSGAKNETDDEVI